LGLVVSSVACGSDQRRRVKSPEERLQEQEELAYKKELTDLSQPKSEQPVEKAAAFDDSGAETQLKQATISAQTCPEVVTEPGSPLGETSVTLTFSHDGSLSAISIPPPFEGTAMGTCAVNAFRNIKTPPYTGLQKVVTWPIKLSRSKK
jgi:hypothetical protein